MEVPENAPFWLKVPNRPLRGTQALSLKWPSLPHPGIVAITNLPISSLNMVEARGRTAPSNARFIVPGVQQKAQNFPVLSGNAGKTNLFNHLLLFLTLASPSAACALQIWGFLHQAPRTRPWKSPELRSIETTIPLFFNVSESMGRTTP